MTSTDFEKTILQQISDVAWLVQRGPERVGILNKNIQEKYTYISGKELIGFDNAEEVKTHFGNLSLFEDRLEALSNIQDTYYIKGFAVDYPDPYALEPDHPDYREDVPLYTKIEFGNVYYAAGYYCIQFDCGWKGGNGPKLATLDKYGFEGPFTSEFEMKQRLRILNKKK